MKNVNPMLKMYLPYIIGAVVLIAVIYTFLSPIKKLLTGGVDGLLSLGDGDNKKKLEDSLDKAIESIPVPTNELKRSNSYYKGLANRLYEAMQSYQPFFASHFSNGDWSELEQLNAAELRQVVKEFGTKEKYSWMGLHSEVTGGLIDWFADDLSGSELTKMKSIFAKTGLW